MKLYFSHPLVDHDHAFGIIGRPIALKAVLPAYVPGRRVRISAFRGGHRVWTNKVAPRRDGPRGVAVARYTTERTGPVTFKAARGRVNARPRKLWVHTWNVSFGARSVVVSLAQRRLAHLGYRAYDTGVYDGATGRAILAWRKVNNWSRTQYMGRAVLGRLIRDKGAFHPKYPKHGRHVEADLSRQVIALIDTGGKVFKTFPISSGKPSTPTVLGHFRFYRKDFGTNSEGMVDSNYFIGGYAIHGYPSVPNYPASHGCLRAFIADAYYIYTHISLGERIDVYP